jgi:hypothetical protein
MSNQTETIIVLKTVGDSCGTTRVDWFLNFKLSCADNQSIFDGCPADLFLKVEATSKEASTLFTHLSRFSISIL